MRHRDAKTRTREHYERLLEDKLVPAFGHLPLYRRQVPPTAEGLRSGASVRQAPPAAAAAAVPAAATDAVGLVGGIPTGPLGQVTKTSSDGALTPLPSTSFAPSARSTKRIVCPMPTPDEGP